MNRYSKVMMALHWATAALVLAAWLTSEGGRHVRLNPPVLHFAFGLSVLVLTAPRLLSRLAGGMPPVEDPYGPWWDLAARIGHWTLYLLLIVLPLTGWYAASRVGVDVSFFGLRLPPLAEGTQGPPGWIAELHQTGGTVVLVLAGIHGLIALWHHFVLRDDTLRRMIPARSLRSSWAPGAE